MQRIDDGVVSRYDKLAANNEINLLLVCRMRMSQGREVQDDIDVGFVEIDARLSGGKEQFFCHEGRERKLCRHILYFFMRRRFEIDPGKGTVRVAGDHGAIVIDNRY